MCMWVDLSDDNYWLLHITSSLTLCSTSSQFSFGLNWWRMIRKVHFGNSKLSNIWMISRIIWYGLCQHWDNLHNLPISSEGKYANTQSPIWYRTWLARNILANYTGKSYCEGNIWQISQNQCIFPIHFQCEFWWMADGSPFSQPKFSRAW